LNISLRDQAINQPRDERGSELMCLLNSCTSRWGKLDIFFGSEYEGVSGVVGRLLQGSAPLLHHLTLYANKRENETMTLVTLDCPPPLNVSLSGVWVLFGACSTSVTDLTLNLRREDPLPRVVGVLNNCPLIQRLKLGLADYLEGNVGFTCTTQTMLPSLVHLELHNIRTVFVTHIGQILRCFNIPNLNSITVQLVPDGPNGLFPLLERTIPDVRNISVINYRVGDWNPSLECLGMEPTIFTHLTELHLLYEQYYIYDKLYSRLGNVIQNLVRSRRGSITHLTIPPFGDNIMELLRGHVPHLKVGPPLKIWDRVKHKGLFRDFDI